MDEQSNAPTEEPVHPVFRFTQIAVNANGNSCQLIRCFVDGPIEDDDHEIDVRKARSARERLVHAASMVEGIREAIQAWRELSGAAEAVSIVQHAVGLKASQLIVGTMSWPTAHEAAIAVGEEVLREWSEAGGNWIFQSLDEPDADCYDGWWRSAEDFIRKRPAETCNALRERMQTLRQNIPPDLWGRIQLEAAEVDNDPSWTLPDDSIPAARTDAKQGVSLLDVAILLDSDEPTAREIVRRWQKSRSPSLPKEIGFCEGHSQRKLYELGPLLEFIRLAGDDTTECERSLRHKLRKPRIEPLKTSRKPAAPAAKLKRGKSRTSHKS